MDWPASGNPPCCAGGGPRPHLRRDRIVLPCGGMSSLGPFDGSRLEQAKAKAAAALNSAKEKAKDFEQRHELVKKAQTGLAAAKEHGSAAIQKAKEFEQRHELVKKASTGLAAAKEHGSAAIQTAQDLKARAEEAIATRRDEFHAGAAAAAISNPAPRRARRPGLLRHDHTSCHHVRRSERRHAAAELAPL